MEITKETEALVLVSGLAPEQFAEAEAFCAENRITYEKVSDDEPENQTWVRLHNATDAHLIELEAALS
jgi:hypothetical protein